MRTYQTVEEQLRDLLHDEQAEGDRMWAQMETQRLKLESTQRELNAAEKEATGYWKELCDLQNNLDDAAKDVLLLLRYARAVYYMADPPNVFWAMPPWMQKWIADVM